MQNRIYGSSPVRIVVVHGGPGGAGELAPLARGLADLGHGVLEPMQTELSVAGQVDELAGVIARNCQEPIVLIGWSWGAWLSALMTAGYPGLVEKLILIGSGPLDAEYAETIMPTRLSRLTEEEQAELQALSADLANSDKVRRMIALIDKADNFAPDERDQPDIVFDKAIFDAVWAEAASLRQSGELKEIMSTISCPVTALHGDHDPHPAEGVAIPLSAILPEADFVLLHQCGHKPWREKYACNVFYETLEVAIG